MRPTFYINSSPIRASGVLFFRKINTSVELLMINNPYNNYFEDIGGKTDPKDKNIFDTVARETEEETNEIINIPKVKTMLTSKNNIKRFYIPQSKYMLYIIECDDELKNLTSEMFGNIEFHTGYERTIEWISKSQYFEINKNPRLIDRRLDRFILDL